MLNNKGFAVSSVLYTLLIAFLLFLGAALAQFSSSSSLIGKANDDLVNGTQFEAVQVKPDGACINTDTEGKDDWYLQYKDDNKNKDDRVVSNTIIKIKSRYGTIYWPKDFKVKDEAGNEFQATINDYENIAEGGYKSYDGKITTFVAPTRKVIDANPDANPESKFYLRIIETEDVTKEATYPISNEVENYGMGIFNICNN